jgi:mono/diheme cytochrome c family protein
MRKVLLFTIAVACSACDEEPKAVKATPASIERGKALYVEHCALCHGKDADGRGVRRSGLVGKPVDFTSRAWRKGVGRQEVEKAIREGKPGTSMASWQSLDDQAIHDLASYVLSVAEGTP